MLDPDPEAEATIFKLDPALAWEKLYEEYKKAAEQPFNAFSQPRRWQNPYQPYLTIGMTQQASSTALPTDSWHYHWGTSDA
jgi:hypothetical protein